MSFPVARAERHCRFCGGTGKRCDGLDFDPISLSLDGTQLRWLERMLRKFPLFQPWQGYSMLQPGLRSPATSLKHRPEGEDRSENPAGVLRGQHRPSNAPAFVSESEKRKRPFRESIFPLLRSVQISDAVL
jgi:hypothetical protein